MSYSIDKATIKRLIQAGAEYALMLNNKLVSDTIPKNLDEYVDYTIKKVITKEVDAECEACGRFIFGSCEGVPDRHRKTITENNRCAAFYAVRTPLQKDILGYPGFKTKVSGECPFIQRKPINESLSEHDDYESYCTKNGSLIPITECINCAKCKKKIK